MTALLQGPFARSDLAVYYVGEAARIDILAANSMPDAGRERFEDVAREYRALAAALDDGEFDDADFDGDISLGQPIVSDVAPI